MMDQGVTVPVQVKGTFDKPEYGVDWGNLAKTTAKKAVKKGLKKLISKDKNP